MRISLFALSALLLSAGPAFADEMDDAWENARPGDSVRYRVERRITETDYDGKDHALKLDMTVEASVVAVKGDVVWLKLAARKPDGSRFDDRWRGRDLLLPMPVRLAEGLEAERHPYVRDERVEAAGRSWECRVERKSNPRKPESTYVEYWSVDDPSLYLARGVVLLKVKIQESGREGTITVSLLGVERGKEGAQGRVPRGLAIYLRDGMWTETAFTAIRGSSARLWMHAGGGWVLEKKASGAGKLPPVVNWRTRGLVDLIDEMGSWWKKYSEKAGLESEGRGDEPLVFKTGSVEVLQQFWSWTGKKDGVKGGSTEFYAAEPWSKALDGLPYEARLGKLRVLGGKAEKQIELERLADWGVE
jgi:hypothetical protein